MIGFFATKSVNSGILYDGIFHDGGGKLLAYQVLAIVIAIAWSTIFSVIIVLPLKFLAPSWLCEPDIGLDLKDHGQQAYEFGDITPTLPQRKVTEVTLVTHSKSHSNSVISKPHFNSVISKPHSNSVLSNPKIVNTNPNRNLLSSPRNLSQIDILEEIELN